MLLIHFTHLFQQLRLKFRSPASHYSSDHVCITQFIFETLIIFYALRLLGEDIHVKEVFKSLWITFLVKFNILKQDY